MKEKIYVSFMMIIFFLSVFMVIFEAGRIKALESRIDIMTVQIKDLQKECRVAKQNSEFVLNLITDKVGGRE